MSDWNASVYHQVSGPQFEWGMAVLSRLALQGDEHALDVGCGTGRLTLELARRVGRGRVTATDRSASMLQKAFSTLRAARIAAVQADASSLPFADAFDVVFSTATFHWVPNHDALFASVFRALRSGGRLHAQCGGGPNLARLLARARVLVEAPVFAPYFRSWREPWFFSGAEETADRLRRAGFQDVVTSVQAAPVTFDNPEAFRTFVDHVCLHPHLSRLPDELKARFSAELVRQAASDDPPFVLDYWRLNLAARRST